MNFRKYKWLFRTRVFGLVIGLAVALFVSLIGYFTPLFQNIESRLLDAYFSIKNLETKTAIQKGVWKSEPNPAINEDILIIGIDIRALQRFGQWPFPRRVHADLVNSFTRIQRQEDRERLLFLDIFFIDDSADLEGDALLAASIKNNGRVFLETVLDTLSNGETVDDEMFSRQTILFENIGKITRISGDWQSIPTTMGIQTNLPYFNEAAAGYGAANVIPDDIDKIVRRQPLVLKHSRLEFETAFESLEPGMNFHEENAFYRLAWTDSKGNTHPIEMPLTERSLSALRRQIWRSAPPLYYDADGDGVAETETRVIQLYSDWFMPSIALSMAVQYYNATLDDVEIVFGKHVTINRPDAPPIQIPVDKNGSMLINFAGYASSPAADGYQTFTVRSYAGYARQTPDDPALWPETRAVTNKILMVGAFDRGMASDEKHTPMGMMFGIEVHANSLNTILTERFIRQPPRFLAVLVTFFIVMLVAWFAARMKNFWSLPLTLLVSISLFLTCSVLFDQFSLLINYSVPLTGIFFTYVSIILYRSSTEEREKRKIRSMFGKYVSPEVVAQMMDHPPELGGVDRELTVFFSDIRGFTSLSETLTPQELVKHLNIYLSAMTDIILETGGTLDKYVGDEIMCFWGAPLEMPDHAFHACRCALLQKKKLAELNEQWPPEKRLAIGIGLNTGIMTVGNMGSEGRMSYTLMGDNVNLGARLEGTNKVYGTMIIVSEYTYAMVKDQFVFRELDTIRVKGKNRPVVIYELLDELFTE